MHGIHVFCLVVCQSTLTMTKVPFVWRKILYNWFSLATTVLLDIEFYLNGGTRFGKELHEIEIIKVLTFITLSLEEKNASFPNFRFY